MSSLILTALLLEIITSFRHCHSKRELLIVRRCMNYCSLREKQLKMFARSSLTFIFIHVGLLVCINVSSEWVDMPQFSDERKIYRMSVSNKNYYSKFNQAKPEGSLIPNDQDIDPIIDSGKDQYSINATVYHQATEEDIVDATTILPEDLSQEIHNLTSASNEKCYNETIKSTNGEILEYLPMDLLKNVHSILRSQPLSAEGKLQFLKKFERILMDEIESRLSRTIYNNREKRGASHHYDHGYDEHEEHSVGFPSIEGALMAISFLTFAVYLVRLVMLLFRNMGNQVTTTATPTLLLGRKRRSINYIEDETARILRRVDEFTSNYIYIRDYIS